jgi:hypothetical protein
VPSDGVFIVPSNSNFWRFLEVFVLPLFYVDRRSTEHVVFVDRQSTEYVVYVDRQSTEYVVYVDTQSTEYC